MCFYPASCNSKFLQPMSTHASLSNNICSATLMSRKTTCKHSQSWIGDWWEGWGFASLALRLASDPLRVTPSHSDSYASDSFPFACSGPFSLIQIYSFTQTFSDPRRLTQTPSDSFSLTRVKSHSDLLSLTQILAISHRLAQLQAVSLRFAQIHKMSLSP